ncbi:MAG: helix-turn-helix domain-containing protein [Dermatophilaceae bacterium]
MGDVPESVSSPAWQALLTRAEERVPELVSEFLHTFNSRALYDPDLVSQEEIRSTAEAIFPVLITRLRGGGALGLDEAIEGSPGLGLGGRRARQGVPLDALLDAIRLDFRILWRMLRHLAVSEPSELLIQHVEWVLTVVDEYVSEVQQAFLRESAIIQRDARLATDRHLARLLSGNIDSERTLATIAAGLGVPPDGCFDVVAVPGDHVAAVYRGLGAQLADGSILGHTYRDVYCLIWLKRSSSRGWPQALDAIPGVYLPGLDGLAAAAQGARTAPSLLSIGPPLSVMTSIDDLWARVAGHHLDEAIPGFSSRRLARLDDLPEHQVEAIVQTLQVYLATGSLRTTAERVYCHRNTVLNRLATFRGLTGLDVTVPGEAALAVLLLAGAKHASPTEHEAQWARAQTKAPNPGRGSIEAGEPPPRR